MRWMIAAALIGGLLAGCAGTGGPEVDRRDPVAAVEPGTAPGEMGDPGEGEGQGQGQGQEEGDGESGGDTAGQTAGEVPGDAAGSAGAGPGAEGEGQGEGEGAAPAGETAGESAADQGQGQGQGQGAADEAAGESGDGSSAELPASSGSGAGEAGGGASAQPSEAGRAAAGEGGLSVTPAAGAGDPGTAAGAAQPGEGPAIERPPGWVPGDPNTHELAIERLRGLSYPGSDLVVVEPLAAGSNYSRAVATYESEGLTIRGLLTIPNGERPATGWPVIIFNHGYIPPAQYRTTERYVAYQDAFARSGYITYKSDYRGHGSSEGDSASSRGSSAYLVDVLNAMASVARLPEADPNRIGMWGHSMGGLITLRAMVVNRQIKAGVIWAGVVASYQDLYTRLGESPRPPDSSPNPSGRRGWRTDLVELFGPPDENPAAWNAVSANAFLADISGPLQLHHGTADHSVPVEYSTRLQEQMEAAGKPSEIFVYQGDDHNLAVNLSTALARSVEFFDRHVKGGG